MSIKTPIYLDNNSTTPMDPRVLDSMLPYFQDRFGNSSSNHNFGWIAKSAAENSRDIISNFLNVKSKEIFFTSGATESINLVHLGLTENKTPHSFQIISTNIEHSATTETLNHLTNNGFRVVFISASADGLINPDLIKSSITDKTKFVSIIYANNEIGTINDIESIGKICKEYGILLHVDATQIIGKIKIDVQKLKIDYLSFSAHKFYGPKGIGVLYVNSLNEKAKLSPRLFGGTQEGSIKPGTLNIPSIVGLGKAIEICEDEMVNDYEHTSYLRDLFYKNVISNLDGIDINGSIKSRLPNNLNIRINDVRADKLMLELRDLAFSNSSACNSGSNKPSSILKAIGLSDEQASCSVRFGFGRFNTKAEIEYASARVIEAIIKLRTLSTNKSNTNKQNVKIS